MEWEEVYQPEDADEGCTLLRPKPPTEWRCECLTRNDAWRNICAYCGQPREEPDE